MAKGELFFAARACSRHRRFTGAVVIPTYDLPVGAVSLYRLAGRAFDVVALIVPDVAIVDSYKSGLGG